MLYYNKSTIDKMVYDLIMQIRVSQQKFSSVVGIANGGLYISKVVAQSLNLPHKTVRISYYEYNGKKRLIPIIESPFPGYNCLVIDDLTDSGETFNTFRRLYGKSHKFGVLFANPQIEKPDFYVKNKPNTWIIFPWE